MNINYKTTTIILSVLVITLTSVVAVLAGNTDSPGPPTDAASESYSLEDLYNRLTAGTAGTQSAFTEPSVAPGTGTMHSINDIMAEAPALDNTNGAAAADVLTGQTFWGLTGGQWGPTTGTMPNNGAGSTIVPTTTNQSVAAGYWSTANTVAGDSDLVAGNIAQGVNLFGVDGSGILASGDATPGQVLNGITFSNSSGAATGTMPDNGAVTITPTTSDQTIALGYHNGSGTVAGDTDLDQWNIRSGVTIFGVTGKCHRLPATGQTTEYRNGDDGTYQYGCRPLVAPQSGDDGGNFNRTDLPWSSSWGAGFTDNGDGTVTDNLTGLIWLQDASCSALAGTDSEGTGNWTMALSAANSLSDGTCGLTDGSSAGDWRLPNFNELRSLIDPAKTNPALPTGHPFTGVQWGSYWSSTTYAPDPYPYSAWYVYLFDGFVYGGNKAFTGFVWPVRSGQ